MAMQERPGEFGCSHCCPADASKAFGAETRRHEHTLVGSSHFDVYIARCTECGQRFVGICTEIIDWVDGDDAEYWDIVPITDEEASQLAALDENGSTFSVAALGDGRRYIKADHPTGGEFRVEWVNGPLIIHPCPGSG